MPLVPHPVAVVDLETTGLGPSDRILEIGVVLLDRDLRQEATWQTLVQPGRDIDNSHIHGITATELVRAPQFEGVAAELAELLGGRVIVAHNAPFDTRFLAAEYARLDVDLPGGTGWSQCTRILSRRLLPGAPQRLSECLDSVGLGNDRPHAALADASATADLYRTLVTRHSATQGTATPLQWPAPVDIPRQQLCLRGESESDHWLERVSANVPATGVAEVDGYRSLLRGALLDASLSVSEIEQLVAASERAGLSREEVNDIHLDYLRQLAVEAWADGVVTATERTQLHDIAVQLAVDPASVDALIAEPVYGEAEDVGLRPGDRVTFTGALTLGRDTWEQRARAAGLEVAAVTRLSALVVAANPDTMSVKARKARDHGVPIVDETTFARMLRDLVPLDPAPEAPEESPPSFSSVFPWLDNLGVDPSGPDDIAHAWLQRHRNVPLREISPRLDPAEVPDSLPRTGAVIARWLNLYPRPLDASVTQLSDVPGFGRLRVHRTLVAVVHSALDTPEVQDYLPVETGDIYLDDPQGPAPQPGVQTVVEWLALLGQLPHLPRETAPPTVAHALDTLAEDPYWSDPATAAIHRSRAELAARIGHDARDLDIFTGRILGKETLEEIGSRHQVTRERIRQLETRLKRRLVEPDDSIHLVLDALGRRFGVLAPLADLRRELPALMGEGPVAGNPMLDTLEWLADEWEISGDWFQRAGFADDLAAALSDFADDFGVVALPAVADNLGVDAHVLRTRLAGEATLYGDHILTRNRSTQDRAAALLAIEGEPLSSLDIVERLGDTNPRTLTNAMSADDRITRTGRDRWALRDWGMEEYSSLAEWIGRRVEGGPVPLDHLLDEAVTTLGVAESSVRLYASSADFQTVDGQVSRAEEIQEVDADPTETPGLYRIGEDLVWLTTVTSDHLRGSGSGIPRGVAAALQVQMLDKRTLPSPLGEQTVSMSRTGATISTIRRFLEAAGISQGERIWLTFSGEGGFDVQHATPRREGLSGIAEVLNATGLDTWINPADPGALGRISRAVGLDPAAPRRRLVSRFRYRRQDDIADQITELPTREEPSSAHP
ncbi:exonuclease domain-containing protein [Corynebacterium comes]|uniref:DNA polymerase III PolC-type n=1 Tax=Corynebacterium comes TaxID=2675218 RepID=A0A6B8WED1_9CORY|nr:exonuclease domain-containing protein [Corynebacterium comes]QGU05068.1 DNA polymerase III PolC-type [Corynebacterium comes]